MITKNYFILWKSMNRAAPSGASECRPYWNVVGADLKMSFYYVMLQARQAEAPEGAAQFQLF